MEVFRSRRIVWAINGLLLFLVVLTVRPFRSWLDRHVIARSIHRDLSVHEIRLHRNRLAAGQSLIEARHFDWTAVYGKRYVGLSAANAWFVVDEEPLVGKEWSIPKALLQNSQLILEALPTASHTASSGQLQDAADNVQSIWQQFLDERLGRPPRWTDHRSVLDREIQADQWIRECGLLVDQWVTTKSQIAEEAKMLLNGNETWDNPLRDPSDIEQRLQQLESLFAEEQELRLEFSSIEDRISAKLDQIGGLFERQRTEWGGNKLEPDLLIDFLDRGAPAEPLSPVAKVAEALIKNAGQKIFAQFQSFGEVADLLCRTALDQDSKKYDRNYRPDGQAILSIGNLTASGTFRSDSVMTPFWLQSQCNVSHRSNAEVASDAEFLIQFDQPPYSVRVQTVRRAEDNRLNSLRIEFAGYMKAEEPSQLGRSKLLAIGTPQWTISSRGPNISGDLELDSRLLRYLSSGLPNLDRGIDQEIECRSKDHPITPIQLKFEGTWNALQWSVAPDQIPAWLLSAIETSEQEQRREVQRQTIAQVEEYFEMETAKIDAAVHRLLDRAQEHSSQFDAELIEARTALTKRLDALNKTEFARTATEELNR